MNLLKNIFKTSKDTPISSYEDFWEWFQKNQKTFFSVVKRHGDIERDFFRKLSPKLNELREGFLYVTGMLNENTVELIFTADGVIKNIIFVEELVKTAPKIEGWQFTALKSPLEIKDVSIEMGRYRFYQENIFFYFNEDPNYPDKVDLTFAYKDFNLMDKDAIITGVLIFLDNFLGELNFITSIDDLNVIGAIDASQELIPIEKLKDFLIWREKEFIEKYNGIRKNTDSDGHTLFEATLENGQPLLATINTDLLKWDAKASHPWILNVKVIFIGNKMGMPSEEIQVSLTALEDALLKDLKDEDGYLYIGRETAGGKRELHFACKDFRKPPKVMEKISNNYLNEFNISYEIYKDKYWQSFQHFLGQ